MFKHRAHEGRLHKLYNEGYPYCLTLSECWLHAVTNDYIPETHYPNPYAKFNHIIIINHLLYYLLLLGGVP